MGLFLSLANTIDPRISAPVFPISLLVVVQFLSLANTVDPRISAPLPPYMSLLVLV